MSIVNKSNTPFYLTGGTALSRHYFNHRFSDDLDLFVNNDKSYSRYIDQVFKVLEESQKSGRYEIDYRRLRKEENYTQLFLKNSALQGEMGVVLKLDLVNDVVTHYGDFEHSEDLGLIDSWRNILSNKIAAVFRYEAKDIADIWIIAKNQPFSWKEIFAEAKTKEAGVDPLVIFEIIKSFPADEISSVKWSIPVNEEAFIADLSAIADDIFKGSENSLCGK